MSTEPADAQPVAWHITSESGSELLTRYRPPRPVFTLYTVTPLYAHPPADAAPDPQPKGFRAALHDSKGSISDAALAEQVRVLREALALLERHVALNCFDQWDIDRNGNWLDKVKSPVLSELLAGAQDALAATAPDGEAQ